jgi:hypothetical protein
LARRLQSWTTPHFDRNLDFESSKFKSHPPGLCGLIGQIITNLSSYYEQFQQDYIQNLQADRIQSSRFRPSHFIEFPVHSPPELLRPSSSGSYSRPDAVTWSTSLKWAAIKPATGLVREIDEHPTSNWARLRCDIGVPDIGASSVASMHIPSDLSCGQYCAKARA